MNETMTWEKYLRLNACERKNAQAWYDSAIAEARKNDLASRWRMFEECDVSGQILRDLGYDFFEADRCYGLLVCQDGVVTINSWTDTDGPDVDGFGMESYYDWWLLDESLQPIPGIHVFSGYSHRDMRNSLIGEMWVKTREKAIEAVRMRRFTLHNVYKCFRNQKP